MVNFVVKRYFDLTGKAGLQHDEQPPQKQGIM